MNRLTADVELQNVKIFSMLGPQELETIRDVLEEEHISADRRLFEQGDEGSELYIVKEGTIGSSIRLEDGSAREIAVFQKGDFFGEMSIFERAPRSATCYAKEDSVILKLPEAAFFALIKTHSEIAIKIMYRMLNIATQRLENTGRFLSDMVTWGEAARKRAVTDEFTGVYNRRFLEDVITDHFRSASREGYPLSLIMIDLDRFREINEAYGNEVGDRVILEAVGVFRRHFRPTDIIARYGGDEFTALLPHTSLKEAHEIAQEICVEVASLTVLKRGGDNSIDQITTSQGVASYPECASDLRDLRTAADEALYRAKDAGKNCVKCAVSPRKGQQT